MSFLVFSWLERFSASTLTHAKSVTHLPSSLSLLLLVTQDNAAHMSCAYVQYTIYIQIRAVFVFLLFPLSYIPDMYTLDLYQPNLITPDLKKQSPSELKNALDLELLSREVQSQKACQITKENALFCGVISGTQLRGENSYEICHHCHAMTMMCRENCDIFGAIQCMAVAAAAAEMLTGHCQTSA